MKKAISLPKTRWEFERMVALFIMTLAFAFFYTVPGGNTADNPNDTQIADAVEDELMLDPTMPYQGIDVGAVQGVVTLSGTVDNMLAKQRAASIARTIKGVSAVVNKIEVIPGRLKTDAEIREDIETALLHNPATEFYEIDTRVSHRVVTFSGTVQSWQERELAEKTAMGVSGVAEIKNEIDVNYAAERSDTEILTDVRSRLRWDALVDGGLIDVSVNDGEVMLSGTVGSAAERHIAMADAWVNGVKGVDAEALKVARWARNKEMRKEKYVIKPDEKVEDAIKKALLFDPRVISLNIEPEVTNGVATLRGEVKSADAKMAAAQDARNTVGVADVNNRLKVRPTSRVGDAELQSRAVEALRSDPYVDRFEISVDVKNGIATLSGAVDTYFEKTEAETTVSRTAGIIGVENNLTVQDTADPYVYDPYVDNQYIRDYEWYRYQPPTYSFDRDREIRDNIQDQIWWSPFVDKDQVTITVENGVATLTGKVDSWSEYHAAAENAWEGGARWVDNDLSVR